MSLLPYSMNDFIHSHRHSIVALVRGSLALMLLLLFFPTQAYSTIKWHTPIQVTNEASPKVSLPSQRGNQKSLALLIRTYEERLYQLRDSMMNDSTPAPAILSEEVVAPFFLPLTFLHTVPQSQLTLGRTPSWTDNVLLHIYLQRPDLVQVTQTLLQQVGPVRQPSTVTEQPHTFIETPKAEEPQLTPVNLVVMKPNFWTFAGDGYLQFLQNYVSDNWYQGGESNYSMVGALTLQANYNNKQKVKWENKLEVKLGLQTAKSDTLHKIRTTQDLLRYTGKLGLQASKKWYYTLQTVAATQMMRTWEKNKKPVVSDFLSPFNLNVSLGMDYNVEWLNKRLTGSVHLAPIALNYKFVHRGELAGRNGIPIGKHHLTDYGSQLTLDLKWKMSDNVQWQTRLYGYTSYHRSEVEWENTFTFQFNRWISAKLFLYPRLDDKVTRSPDHGYWQFKEYTSLGFSYTF